MRRWRARESGWSRLGFPIVLGAAVALLVGSVVATVEEVVTGPAIVRPEGRLSVAADIPGSLDVVLVAPGDHVESDQVLARIAPEAALETEAERLRQELDKAIARVLFDPSDGLAARTVAELEASLRAARLRIEGGVVRAVAAATVAEVRGRLGQKVSPGEAIVTVVPDDAPVVVAAFLPAHERGRLAVGQRLEVRLPTASAETAVIVPIESVDAPGDPGEASVVVHGRVPAAGPGSRGGTGREGDSARPTIPIAGRAGIASIVVRTEPVLFGFMANLRGRPRGG